MQRGHIEQLTDGVYGIQYKPNSPEAMGARDDGWISVEDRLPEEGEVVLFVDKTYSEANVECGQYSGTTFYSYPDDNPPWGNVTHWMPLPEPPEE